MRKNLYNHGAATIASVSPIGAGGSSANDQRQALENLGGIPPGSPMLITLDDKAKVNKSLFGTAVAPTPTIDGIYDVASNTNYTYTITNFDKDLSYNLSQLVGASLVSFIRENIVIRTLNNLQANDQVGFTLNNKIVRLAPIPNGVNKPTVLAPTNNATGVDEILEFRCSTFSNVGDPDSHKDTTWEIATDIGFTNIVHTVTNTAFSYNLTDRSVLNWAQAYYVRVKQTGVSERYSDWSDVVKFTVMTAPAKPVFSIESAAALQTVSVNEGDTGTTNVVLTIKRTGSYLGISSDVYWAITLLTANSEDVQSTVNGTVNFASGVTSETISIGIVGDYSVESAETFKVAITCDTNSVISSTKSQVTVTITDNDIVPVVNVSSSVATIGEPLTGEVDVTFFINRTGNIKIASTVSWAVITTGTGYVSAADFGSSTQTFTGTSSFGVDETQKSVTFKLKADSVSENNEIVDFTISTPVGCSLGTTTNVQVTVTKPVPIVGVSSVSPVSITEPLSGTTDVTFTITKTGAEACSVDWTLASGVGFISAADLASGESTSGTVNFIASDTSKTVVLSVKSDSDFSEGAEILKLQLSNPSGCTIDPANSYDSCTISDGMLPVLNISTAYTTVSEPTGSTTTDITFTIVKTGAGACTCNVTRTGTATSDDFTNDPFLSVSTLNFPSYDSDLKTVTFTLKSDSVTETAETLTLTLSSPSGCTIGTASATATIQDGTVLPVLNISVNPTTVTEPSGSVTTDIVFTVTKTGAGACTCSFTPSGTATAADFNAPFLTATTLSFASSDTVQTATVTLKSDAASESTETLTVTIGSPTGCTIGTSTATVNIQDGAVLPVYSIAAGNVNTVEGFTVNFTVSRDVTTSTGSVNWAITGGTATAADFTAGQVTSGTLNFAAGEYGKAFAISLKDDGIADDNESIIVSLSNPVNGTLHSTLSTVTAYTVDPAALPVYSIGASTFGAGGLMLNEGSTFEFIISRTVSSSAGSVTWTKSGYSDAADFAAGTPTTGTISFAAGETTKYLNLVTVTDNTVEGNETIVITLSNVVGGGTINTTSPYTATIVNVAQESVIGITADTNSLAEPASGTTTITVTASRSINTSSACSIGWTSDIGAGGTANMTLDDFNPGQSASGSFYFGAGETSVTQTFIIRQDNNTETRAESFTVTLNPTGTNCRASTVMDTVTVNVIAESAYTPPVIQFRNNGAQTATEGESVYFYIDVTGDRSRTSSVTLTLVSIFGNVTLSDFTNVPVVSHTIDLDPGPTSTLQFNFAINDDGNNNGEMFAVVLTGPVNCTIAPSDASTNNHTFQQVGVINAYIPFDPKSSLFTDYTKSTSLAGHSFLQEAIAQFSPYVQHYMVKLAIKLTGFTTYANRVAMLEIYCPGGDIFTGSYTPGSPVDFKAMAHYRNNNLFVTAWDLINAKTVRSPYGFTFDASGNYSFDNVEIVLSSRREWASHLSPQYSGNHYCYFRVVDVNGNVIYSGADSNNGGTEGGFIGPSAFFYSYVTHQFDNNGGG